MESAYLMVSGALTLLGLGIGVIWRAQRQRIWLAGWLMTPFGLFEMEFEPEYWQPGHVWVFVPGIPLGFEDFLFCWGIGSLIWALAAWPILPYPGQILVGRRTVVGRFLVGSLICLGLVFGSRVLGLDVMSSVLLGFGAPGVVLVLAKWRAWRLAASGAIQFGTLHLVVVWLSFQIWPEAPSLWNSKTPWSQLFLGVPLGELVWALAIGAIWPTALAWFTEPQKTE